MIQTLVIFNFDTPFYELRNQTYDFFATSALPNIPSCSTPYSLHIHSELRKNSYVIPS